MSATALRWRLFALFPVRLRLVTRCAASAARRQLLSHVRLRTLLALHFRLWPGVRVRTLLLRARRVDRRPFVARRRRDVSAFGAVRRGVHRCALRCRRALVRCLHEMPVAAFGASHAALLRRARRAYRMWSAEAARALGGEYRGAALVVLEALRRVAHRRLALPRLRRSGARPALVGIGTLRGGS